MLTRRSERTGWPMASHILRTCRVRPSWMVTRSSEVAPCLRSVADQFDPRRRGAAAFHHHAAREPIEIVRVGNAEHLSPHTRARLRGADG